MPGTANVPVLLVSQYGGAKYIPTGRGYAIKHNTFVKVGVQGVPWLKGGPGELPGVPYQGRPASLPHLHTCAPKVALLPWGWPDTDRAPQVCPPCLRRHNRCTAVTRGATYTTLLSCCCWSSCCCWWRPRWAWVVGGAAERGGAAALQTASRCAWLRRLWRIECPTAASCAQPITCRTTLPFHPRAMRAFPGARGWCPSPSFGRPSGSTRRPSRWAGGRLECRRELGQRHSGIGNGMLQGGLRNARLASWCRWRSAHCGLAETVHLRPSPAPQLERCKDDFEAWLLWMTDVTDTSTNSTWWVGLPRGVCQLSSFSSKQC